MAKCRSKTKSGKSCRAAAIGKTGRCLFHSKPRKNPNPKVRRRRKMTSYDKQNQEFVRKHGYNMPRNWQYD